jgi:hypothetical protein
MDFTVKTYRKLLNALIDQSYTFQTFHQFLEKPAERVIILRHDVDAMPGNSLRFAEIQHEQKVQGTYYFRIIPSSFDEAIIRKIAALGHEIGYHYETMDTCKGDVSKAYIEFTGNLEIFRKITAVHTISMHGSPLSRFDNRTIWKEYDYKKLGLTGEPYFDMDFNDVFYVTDTGRRWDGHLYNVRDKATKENPVTNEDFLKLHFHSTSDIIETIRKGQFPVRAMINFHPQRWNDSLILWSKELIMQNAKNVVKRYFLVNRAGK